MQDHVLFVDANLEFFKLRLSFSAFGRDKWLWTTLPAILNMCISDRAHMLRVQAQSSISTVKHEITGAHNEEVLFFVTNKRNIARTVMLKPMVAYLPSHPKGDIDRRRMSIKHLW